MSFTEAVKTCLRKYATFSGRASRAEYWWFALFGFLGGLFFTTLEQLINNATGTGNGPTILSSAFNIATFIPTLAVGWRRMHDIGRSGVYYLYPLLVMFGVLSFSAMAGLIGYSADPSGAISGLLLVATILAAIALLISPLVLLWWLTRPSQSGTNEYGPNPHEVTP